MRHPEREERGEEKGWQRLAVLSSERKARIKDSMVKDGNMLQQVLTEGFVIDLLTKTNSNISEFSKFKFCWKFCSNKQGKDAAEGLIYMKMTFLHLFNFALMSLEERVETIQMGIPQACVYNALHKSSVLTPEDIVFFQSAFQQLGWCLLSASSRSEFTPQEHLLSLTEGGGVLLLFQLPDMVTLAFLFPGPLTVGVGLELEAGSMQAFFMSRRFDLRRQFICPTGFYYDLTGERFQIYREKDTTKSFFWFRSGLSPTSKKDPLNEVLLSLSIDLSQFPGNLIRRGPQFPRPHPLITKAAFSRVEVFRLPRGQEPTYLGVQQVNWRGEVPQQHEERLEGVREERDASDIIIENLNMKEEAASSSLLVLLQELVVASAPCTVITSTTAPHHKQVTDKLRQVLVDFQPGLREGICAASCLSRLGQPDLGAEVLARVKVTNIEELVSGLEEWRHFFYLDTQTAWQELERVVGEVRGSLGVEENGMEYLVTQLWHNLVQLLVQLRQFKEQLGESREVATGLRLEEVKVSESEEGTDTLSLYGGGQATWVAEDSLVGVCIGRHYTDTFRSIVVLASVFRTTPAPLTLKLRLLEPRPTLLDCQWLGEEDTLTVVSLKTVNSTVYSRVVEAVKSHLPTAGRSLLKLARPEEAEKAATENNALLKETSELNLCQTKAVTMALSQSVTVIQGPPGTGKTQVAVSIITSAVERGNRVLAIAETNIAVDNMTRRLARKGVAVLRLGRLEKVDCDMVEHTLEGQLQTLAEQESRRVKTRDPRTGRSLPKKGVLKGILW